MSTQTSQKYYLINLSTRNVSVSTHLRSENFTLGSGKCIYLGSLTDEQILKYHRYSALNISLRILTPDKAPAILNKSINATENMKESILSGKPMRVEHEAGSISTTSFGIVDNKKSKMFTNPQLQQKTVVSQPKQEVVESKPVVAKEQTVVKQEEKKEELKVEEVVAPVQEDVTPKQEVVEPKNEAEEDVVESKVVDGDTVDESLLPKQIDVVVENAKIELENMSYNELYDLAKASNLTFKKKPSKQKLIEALAEAQL